MEVWCITYLLLYNKLSKIYQWKQRKITISQSFLDLGVWHQLSWVLVAQHVSSDCSWAVDWSYCLIWKSHLWAHSFGHWQDAFLLIVWGSAFDCSWHSFSQRIRTMRERERKTDHSWGPSGTLVTRVCPLAMNDPSSSWMQNTLTPSHASPSLTKSYPITVSEKPLVSSHLNQDQMDMLSHM